MKIHVVHDEDVTAELPFIVEMEDSGIPLARCYRGDIAEMIADLLMEHEGMLDTLISSARALTEKMGGAVQVALLSQLTGVSPTDAKGLSIAAKTITSVTCGNCQHDINFHDHPSAEHSQCYKDDCLCDQFK